MSGWCQSATCTGRAVWHGAAAAAELGWFGRRAYIKHAWRPPALARPAPSVRIFTFIGPQQRAGGKKRFHNSQLDALSPLVDILNINIGPASRYQSKQTKFELLLNSCFRFAACTKRNHFNQYAIARVLNRHKSNDLLILGPPRVF